MLGRIHNHTAPIITPSAISMNTADQAMSTFFRLFLVLSPGLSPRFLRRRTPLDSPVPGTRPTRPMLGASPADLSTRWARTDRFTSRGFILVGTLG